MIQTQQQVVATFADGEATSTVINSEGYSFASVEVPSGDEAAAVTIQGLSGDGSTWLDAVTLADTTNTLKPMTAAENLAFAPLKKIRLKLGSGVSGDKTYYVNMSS